MTPLVNILFLTVIYLEECNGANILGIFNKNLYGSFMIGQNLFERLSKNGHNVTLVNTYNDDEVSDFRNIYLEMPEEIIQWDEIISMSVSQQLTHYYEKSIIRTNLTLSNPAVQELMLQGTFDLVILEQEYNEALKGLCHHFRAHCVVISSTGPNFKTNHLVNNISPPSFIPAIFTGYSYHMSYFQRAYNAICKYFQNYSLYYNYLKQESFLLNKYFPEMPNIHDLINNVSLILLNWHFSFNQPVPYMPNMIPVGGLHIEKPNVLQTELQKLLDDAIGGVIYINFGEEFRSKDLPVEKLNAFINTLSSFEMQVIWKYEDEIMSNKPTNVHIFDWLPQKDILAHPNIKLFITRGGTLSIIEAICFGVPVLGIPMREEDIFNIGHAVETGFGLKLNYDEVTEESLEKALTTILNDYRYAEKAKEQKIFLLDRPIQPLSLAVYWIEYILNHNGAPFLQSPTLKLPWYKYYLVDLLLFIVAAITTPIILMVLICKNYKRVKCIKRVEVNVVDDREEWKKLI